MAFSTIKQTNKPMIFQLK